MDKIGTFEAKNKLSDLLTRAERGEEIVITRRAYSWNEWK
jgi:prevent-host-death family protein